MTAPLVTFVYALAFLALVALFAPTNGALVVGVVLASSMVALAVSLAVEEARDRRNR